MARGSAFNDNLAFQPKGTAQEARIRVEQAMQVVREYCAGRGHQRDVHQALNHIEDHCPKTEKICDEIRATFLLDDATQAEQKKLLGQRAFNRLASRLNNRPI